LIERFHADYTGDRAEHRSRVPGFNWEICNNATQLLLIPKFLEVLRNEGRGGRNPAAENSSSSQQRQPTTGVAWKTVHLIVEGLHKTDWVWGFEAAQPNKTRWRWEVIASGLSPDGLLRCIIRL